MKEEEVKGPTELVEGTKKRKEGETDDEVRSTFCTIFLWLNSETLAHLSLKNVIFLF